MLGIFSAGIAPGLALLSYFYLKDEYDAEPISMVLRTFLYGALLVFPIMFIQYVIDVEQLIQSDFINAIVTTSLLEEFFKWFILFYVIYQHVEFDEPYDGIVYGTSVALGFATVENILYLFANGLEHAVGRALLPVSSHALFGVIMGYYFGKGKFSAVKKKLWLALSLMFPTLLHGLYDYIVRAFDYWLMFIFPFMIFLWWLAMRKVKSARTLSGQHFEKHLDSPKTLQL